MSHTDLQIIEAVREKIAQKAPGYRRDDSRQMDIYSGTVTLDQNTYHVLAGWLDGAKAHEVTLARRALLADGTFAVGDRLIVKNSDGEEEGTVAGFSYDPAFLLIRFEEGEIPTLIHRSRARKA